MLELTSDVNQTEKSLAHHNGTVPSVQTPENHTASGARSQPISEKANDIVSRAVAELRTYAPQGTFTYWMYLTFAIYVIYDTIQRNRTAISEEIRTYSVVGMTMPAANLQWFHNSMVTDIRNVMVVCAIALCSERMSQARKSRKRLKAMNCLANSLDPRSLGPMINAIRRDTAVRKTAIEGLTAMLPKLGSGDGEILERDQLKELNSLVKTYSSDPAIIKVQCSALSAYQYIGDANALKVALDLAYGDTRVQEKVREAAIACLPGLKALLGPRQVGKELLRPCGYRAESAEMLVRPASATEDVHANELLRVGAKHNETSCS